MATIISRPVNAAPAGTLSVLLSSDERATLASLPVSTAAKAELDAKAPLDSPVFVNGIQVGGGQTVGAITLQGVDGSTQVISGGDSELTLNGLIVYNMGERAYLKGDDLTALRTYQFPDASG